MTRLEDFSLEEYRRLLARVCNGRTCLRFGDFAPPNDDPLRLRSGEEAPERFVILRHDVDFSPDCALRLAEAEAEQACHATYFFLLTCDWYNLLAPSVRSLPQRIVEMGHEVGLHYDVPVLAQAPSPRQALQRQAALLEELAGRPVRSIAMHNPGWNGTDPFRNEPDLISAYHPAFTRQIAYFSDSCGAWRDAAHAALTSGNIPPRLQLLIHPVYWGDGPGDRHSRLAEWRRQRDQAAADFLHELEQLWPGHAGVIEHDRRTGAANRNEKETAG